MAGQNSCLGIYFDNDIIKYAKLEKAGDGTLNIKNHAVKFVKEQDISDAIFSVISETNAVDIPVVISTPNVKYSDFKVLKQISNADRNNIIRLEFEEWCDRNVKNVDDYTYVQNISDVVQEEHFSGIVAIAPKADVTKFQEIGPKKINAMYPYELTMVTSDTVDEPNYILVNLDKELMITTVMNSKKVDTVVYEIGMKQIVDSFIDLLGSYPKAYEACKQMNVFSDGEASTNKVQFEQIVEPILQEVLQKCQDIINKYRSNISKVYITGMGTLFTNIDTLFTEYFNIRTEIYKPKFVSEIGDVRNMAEVLETLPAVSMAKYYFQSSKENFDFIKKQAKQNTNILDNIKKMFKSNPNKVKKAPSKKIIIDFEKIEKVLAYPTALIITFVVGYNVFTNLYVKKMEDYIAQYDAKTAEYQQAINIINSDASMISGSTGQYRSVNEQINSLISQVQNNEIGKYTTYNVASFTQKLAKIIPDNILLTYIASDDNKHVTIGATADSYPDIGYFVANLRLNPDILQNIAVNSIVNGEKVTIEIGGDLP